MFFHQMKIRLPLTLIMTSLALIRSFTTPRSLLTQSRPLSRIQRHVKASRIISGATSAYRREISRTIIQMTMKSNYLSLEECLERYSSRKDTGTIFVDGSWHLSSRDGRQEYEEGPRIPDAVFFDIDDVATKDHPSNLPHMMPPKKLFALVMDQLGIESSSDIILYGTKGCFSIPRAFYTLRAMGHAEGKVHMMQGSLQDWIDAGGEVESGRKESVRVADLDLDIATKYDAAVDAQNVVDIEKIKEVVKEGDDADSIIVDARSAGRFVGEAPEPRPGLRGGHMPNAKNVPFNILMEEGNMNKFLPREDLIRIFKDAGVDVNTEKKVICTCGSGVTACVLTAALEECGRDPSTTSIYDGSWIEWASDENTPVVK